MTLRTEEEFWLQVVRHGLPWFRWFRRAVSVDEVDAAVGEYPDWLELRAKMIPGDLIWPFCFPGRTRYWGNKYGYVVLRRGKFVGGIVTTSE